MAAAHLLLFSPIRMIAQKLFQANVYCRSHYSHLVARLVAELFYVMMRCSVYHCSPFSHARYHEDFLAGTATSQPPVSPRYVFEWSFSYRRMSKYFQKANMQFYLSNEISLHSKARSAMFVDIGLVSTQSPLAYQGSFLDNAVMIHYTGGFLQVCLLSCVTRDLFCAKPFWQTLQA